MYVQCIAWKSRVPASSNIVSNCLCRALKRSARCPSGACSQRIRSASRLQRLRQRSSTVSARLRRPRSSCSRTISCSDWHPTLFPSPPPPRQATPSSSSCCARRRLLRRGRSAPAARARSLRSFSRSTRRRAVRCPSAFPRHSSVLQLWPHFWRYSFAWRSSLVSLRTAFLLRPRPPPSLFSPPPKCPPVAADRCSRQRSTTRMLPRIRPAGHRNRNRSATRTCRSWLRLCIFQATSEFVCV